MDYSYERHGTHTKIGDPIIDGFIKWIIFNPYTFGTFLIAILAGSVIQTFVYLNMWDLPLFVIGLVASVALPLIYFNTSKRGAKLYETKTYYRERGFMSALPNGKQLSFYQSRYIVSFPDEFNE